MSRITTLHRSAMNAHLTGSLLAVALGAGALAGPIDPPAAVGPTYKTLFEVEPRTAMTDDNTPGDADSVFRITSPGSYYLTDNVVVPNGFNGIEIASQEVTLDLNGFRIAGASATGSGDAIVVFASEAVTVRNGHIEGMGGSGVSAQSTRNLVVEDVFLDNIGGDALEGADFATFRRCVVRTADMGGIAGGSHSRVEDCAVSDVGVSSPAGIDAPVNGVTVGANSVVTGSMADGCLASGFVVGNGSLISGCTSQNNIGAGFDIDDGSTIRDSSAYNNEVYGIDASTGCTVIGNTAAHNGSGSAFGEGISAESGSTVVNNTCRGNSLSGITVQSSCLVQGNTVDVNGVDLFQTPSAGILVNGRGNRIDSNSVVSNIRGIQCVGSDNFVIRNTLFSNITQFDMAAGNIWTSTNNPATAASFANLTN